MYGIDGKTAVVTGAGSGIGRATARRLAEEGANVVLADVAAEQGEEVAAAIDEAGGEAAFVEADVTRDGDIESMLEVALDTYGGLDLAHNNVGWAGLAPQRLGDLDAEAWARELELSLTSTWRCLRAELPLLQADGGGAVVNTSSLAGLRGRPHIGAYAASKHGVVGLTRSAALEYAGEGVRVNAVCPGAVDTPALRSLRGDELDEQREQIPLGRLADPEDVAGAVAWLCSADASYVTGHALVVDGGKSVGPSA